MDGSDDLLHRARQYNEMSDLAKETFNQIESMYKAKLDKDFKTLVKEMLKSKQLIFSYNNQEFSNQINIDDYDDI